MTHGILGMILLPPGEGIHQEHEVPSGAAAAVAGDLRCRAVFRTLHRDHGTVRHA